MEGPASFSAAATGHSGGLDRLGCQRCPAGVDLGTSARVGSCSGRLRCLGCPSWRGRRQAGGGGPWEAPGRGDSPFVSWAKYPRPVHFLTTNGLFSRGATTLSRRLVAVPSINQHSRPPAPFAGTSFHLAGC